MLVLGRPGISYFTSFEGGRPGRGTHAVANGLLFLTTCQQSDYNFKQLK